jgi:hypothetical protein
MLDSSPSFRKRGEMLALFFDHFDDRYFDCYDADTPVRVNDRRASADWIRCRVKVTGERSFLRVVFRIRFNIHVSSLIRGFAAS